MKTKWLEKNNEKFYPVAHADATLVDESNTTLTEVLNGKQNTLSTAQLNAANSGITSAKVSTYDGYATGKQNTLSFMTAPSSTNKVATKTEIDTEDAQIADIYNRTGGGKNLLKLDDKTWVTGGIPLRIENNIVYANGTNTGSFVPQIYTYSDGLVFDYDVIITPPTKLIGVKALLEIKENGKTSYPSVASGYVLKKGVKLTKIYAEQKTVNTTIDLEWPIMLRPTYIQDDTFVPYVPTNAELNDRVSVIEDKIPIKSVAFADFATIAEYVDSLESKYTYNFLVDSSQAMTDKPTGSGMYTAYKYSGNTIKVVAYGLSSTDMNTVYTRLKSNGVWRNWVKFTGQEIT